MEAVAESTASAFPCSVSKSPVTTPFQVLVKLVLGSEAALSTSSTSMAVFDMVLMRKMKALACCPKVGFLVGRLGSGCVSRTKPTVGLLWQTPGPSGP